MLMRYAACGIVAVTFLSVEAFAQTPAPPADGLRFEVASIKPCDPRNAATPDEFMRLLTFAPLSGNRFYQPCARVVELALFAYDVPRSRLRYPPSASLEFFEIDGRASSPAGVREMRLMVRQLLAGSLCLPQSHRGRHA